MIICKECPNLWGGRSLDSFPGRFLLSVDRMYLCYLGHLRLIEWKQSALSQCTPAFSNPPGQNSLVEKHVKPGAPRPVLNVSLDPLGLSISTQVQTWVSQLHWLTATHMFLGFFSRASSYTSQIKCSFQDCSVSAGEPESRTTVKGTD